MTDKKKWITIAICFGILILGAGIGLYKPGAEGKSLNSITELSGRTLGGVSSRMPESSAKIMFESLTGQKLAAYKAYSSPDEAIAALKSGKAASVWFLDVSAKYLAEKDPGLKILKKEGMSDITALPGERFELGLAVKNDAEGEELITELNEALRLLSESGRIKALTETYIDGASSAEKFSEKDMLVKQKTFTKSHSGKTLYIGITGAVPPVELIDSDGRAYGFCAALMDEIGQYCGRSVEFVVLNGETVFTSLMSGKIDAVFCYGTGNITTEGKKKWFTTEGYYPIYNYEFLTGTAE